MHKKLAFPLLFILVDEPVQQPIQAPPTEYSLRSSSPTEHHEYIYASGRLMREVITTTANGTSTTEVLDFVYGSGSTPLALVYTNGTASPVTCYYITNIQGDVVKMVNASGTVVAEYAYDAWGKVISATGDMAEVNPIRYRGYYYDAETELYYLQSRYYDPAVKRFVNADAVTTTGQEFVGFNMFAYCGNNPIIRTDATGNWWNDFLDELDKRLSHWADTMVRIIKSPFKATSVEVGGGVGIGAKAEVSISGVPVEVGAVASISDYVVYDKGKFDAGNKTTVCLGINIAEVFDFSYANGREHSFSDDLCTCDWWESSFGEKSECTANKPFEERSGTISISTGAYFLFGFEFSISIDLVAWNDELTDIYFDSVDYGE